MTSTGVDERALFNEPGAFVVRPDRTLYWTAVQSIVSECPTANC